jgi:cold shock protein
MPTGKIKTFHDDRGFGFITPDDGARDVFFHITSTREGDEIAVGSPVTFQIGIDRFRLA